MSTPTVPTRSQKGKQPKQATQLEEAETPVTETSVYGSQPTTSVPGLPTETVKALIEVMSQLQDTKISAMIDAKLDAKLEQITAKSDAKFDAILAILGAKEKEQDPIPTPPEPIIPLQPVIALE